MKTPNPQPVVVSTICSMCGLDWQLHGEKPTTEDCIRLLKAELANRPPTVITIPTVYPYPVYPNPTPYWYTTYNDNTLNDGHSVVVTNTTSCLAPGLATAIPVEVAA
jgi:hypothetical protein